MAPQENHDYKHKPAGRGTGLNPPPKKTATKNKAEAPQPDHLKLDLDDEFFQGLMKNTGLDEAKARELSQVVLEGANMMVESKADKTKDELQGMQRTSETKTPAQPNAFNAKAQKEIYETDEWKKLEEMVNTQVPKIFGIVKNLKSDGKGGGKGV